MGKEQVQSGPGMVCGRLRLWQPGLAFPPPPTPLHWACHPEDGTPRCVMVVAEGDAV